MNAWKVACATLVIFIAGIITGASLVRFAERGPRSWQRTNKAVPESASAANLSSSPKDPRSPNAASPSSLLLSRDFVQILARQLRLTSEQRERIDQIMASGQQRMRELRASLEPQTRKQLLDTREQIRALLTPEQREQFEQLMKQRNGRRNDGLVQPERERRFREQRNPVPHPDSEPPESRPLPPHEPSPQPLNP